MDTPMTTSDTLPAAWPITHLIERLRQHRASLAARYHIASLGVFGSYVHNAQHDGSDLDILVTFSQTPGLFTLVNLEDELSTLLGVPVDLTIKDELKRRIGQRILREVIEL